MTALNTELNRSAHALSSGQILPQVYDPTADGWVVISQTTTKTVTIASGASLSDEVDLEGYRIASIFMPATWTTANLTFAASNATGGTFNAFYDDTGTEVGVTAADSRTIGIDTVAGALASVRYLKVRSGTVGTAVNQGDERSIIFILKR